MSWVKLIVVLAMVLLNGCALLPESDLDDAVALESKAKQVPEQDKQTAIDARVLYMLLTAEIAGQRQQYGVALEGYLQAARRVQDARISERAAKIALHVKDSRKTDEAVSLWLQQEPNNLVARRIAALSALRDEDKILALEHLGVLLQQDPAGFEQTLVDLVKVLGKQNKATFIYDTLEDLQTQYPNSAAVFFVQALLAMELKQTELAEQKIGKALELQPDWNKALVFQAQLAVFSGDIEKAKRLLADVIDKLPDSRKLKKLLAQVLIQDTDFEGALDVYQDMILENPKDFESQFSLALLYLQLDQDDDAKKVFEVLLGQPAWQARAQLYLGRVAVRAEEFSGAVKWFDQVARGSLVYDAKMAAATVLLKQKEFAEVAARLDKLQEQFPKQQIQIKLLRAEFFNVQKQYRNAFELLTQLLEKRPNQKEVLYTRALIAERIDRLDILEADLKKILKQYPDDVNALNALGYTLADRTERYKEAEIYLNKAIRFKPNEAVIQDSYGWLQFKLGHLALAMEYLEKAYEALQEAEIAAHLIEVQWQLGEQDEARDMLEEWLEKAPKDKRLLDLQQRLLVK